MEYGSLHETRRIRRAAGTILSTEIRNIGKEISKITNSPVRYGQPTPQTIFTLFANLDHGDGRKSKLS